jgi:hypothetical protein
MGPELNPAAALTAFLIILPSEPAEDHPDGLADAGRGRGHAGARGR